MYQPNYFSSSTYSTNLHLLLDNITVVNLSIECCADPYKQLLLSARLSHNSSVRPFLRLSHG